jgi:DNA 3'-phosphatase
MTKIIFADLDSTLIETRSGKTFPLSILDFKPIWKVWKYLKAELNDGDYFFIVSNQGGIEKGLVKTEQFESKISYICFALEEYIKKDITIDYSYCSSNDPNNPCRKPNIKMLESLTQLYNLQNIPKSSMLMIGDASGRPGDFSDSDLKTAINFGIKYLDVDDVNDI